MKTLHRVFFFFCLFAFGAVGAEAISDLPAVAPHTDWLAAAGHIAADLLPIIGAALAVLGTWALKKLATKLHLDGIINTQQIVDDAVQKGIGYAEAWAEKQTTKPTGNQKLDIALGFADDILKKQAVQDYGKDHLAKLTEHFLQQQAIAPLAPVTGT